MRLNLRSRRGVVLVAVAGVLLVAAATVAYVRVWGTHPSADTTLRGWQVEVNGHSLYVECQGVGSPAVILDSGLGDDSTVWDDVLLGTENAAVRVCAYDRWGLGSSDANAAGTRPIGDATTDLHALLAAADVSPPYILVSHSIAGLIHRDFTKRYPAEVAGLVMVDTAPDDWNLYMKIDEFTFGSETLDIATVAASLRAGDDLGERPVAVILGATSDQIDPRPGFRDYWRAAQHALAALSSNSIVVVAADSDHGIPTTQPDLVSTAIGLVVAAVTSDRPIPACARFPQLGQDGGRCDDAPVVPAPARSQM